jgi:membrane-associated protease RseP (regulator of RpoE activity)
MSTNFTQKKMSGNKKLMASLCSAALASIFVAAAPVPGISGTLTSAATSRSAEMPGSHSGSSANGNSSDSWPDLGSDFWPGFAAMPAPQFEAGGWLGVAIAEVTPDRAKELKLSAAQGVVVSQLSENSPAAKAGLKKDDVITQYNGQRVEGAVEFRRMVRETPVGHTAQLTIWRDAHSQTISVEIGSYPAGLKNENEFSGVRPRNFPGGDDRQRVQPPSEDYFDSHAAPRGPMLGVSAMDLSGQLGEYFGAPAGEGVLVTEVPKDSAGEKAGLRAGDVIAKVNGERVRNRAELRQQLQHAVGNQSGTKNVSLGVIRKGAETTVSIQPQMAQPPAGSRNGHSREPNGIGPRIPL